MLAAMRVRELQARCGFGLLAACLCTFAPAQEVSLRTVQQAGSAVKYDPDGPPQKPGAVVKAEPGLHFTGLEHQVPLKRVERLLAEGQVDAFFCLLKSPERERQWRYSPVPLYIIRHVIVQRADDARHFDTLNDLAAASHKKRVLVMRGTAIARHLLQADVAIAEVSSEREALQMLTMGRADLIYGQDINLQRHIVDTRQGNKFKFGRTVFQEEPQYLALRADLPPAYEERLTQALRKLEKDGTLRQLTEKYR
jgi:ABC-type amino acid transport substrate-binding protein